MTEPDAVTPGDIERAMAAIGGIVRRTPVLEIPGSEIGVDATILFKLEYLQHSGTFKGRGASHFVATQPIADAGVVAASGGNHGAAVAWAARRFGHAAHIFVPEIAAEAKVDRLRSYGATVHQGGAVYDDALTLSKEFLEHHPATSIHAYDDVTVMAGAGTCSLEFEQQAGEIEAVLLACGGGGLSGGASAWFGRRVEVVACETDGTPAYSMALAANRPVAVEVSGAGADALGASSIGDIPWAALSAARATSAVVTDDALLAAKDFLWNHLRIVVEPSAAAPLAALMTRQWEPRSNARVGVVLCGANTSIV